MALREWLNRHVAVHDLTPAEELPHSAPKRRRRGGRGRRLRRVSVRPRFVVRLLAFNF